MLSALALASIRAYRILISPLLGQNCRFHPSCSAYAEEAVRRYGALRGLWRGVRRLARCHPFHPGGYDPVESVAIDDVTRTGCDDARATAPSKRQATA